MEAVISGLPSFESPDSFAERRSAGPAERGPAFKSRRRYADIMYDVPPDGNTLFGEAEEAGGSQE
jgi:hypothetical protein